MRISKERHAPPRRVSFPLDPSPPRTCLGNSEDDLETSSSMPAYSKCFEAHLQICSHYQVSSLMVSQYCFSLGPPSMKVSLGDFRTRSG
jgi:hypothetical protein